MFEFFCFRLFENDSLDQIFLLYFIRYSRQRFRQLHGPRHRVFRASPLTPPLNSFLFERLEHCSNHPEGCEGFSIGHLPSATCHAMEPRPKRSTAVKIVVVAASGNPTLGKVSGNVLSGAKSPLFVKERALSVRGVVKTVFEGVFLFIPRTKQSKARVRGNLQIASFRCGNRREYVL